MNRFIRKIIGLTIALSPILAALFFIWRDWGWDSLFDLLIVLVVIGLAGAIPTVCLLFVMLGVELFNDDSKYI